MFIVHWEYIQFYNVCSICRYYVVCSIEENVYLQMTLIASLKGFQSIAAAVSQAQNSQTFIQTFNLRTFEFCALFQVSVRAL